MGGTLRKRAAARPPGPFGRARTRAMETMGQTGGIGRDGRASGAGSREGTKPRGERIGHPIRPRREVSVRDAS